MSYLLWAIMPDAELSALADGGTLHEPAVLQGPGKADAPEPAPPPCLTGSARSGWVWETCSKTFDTAKFPQMTSALVHGHGGGGTALFESIVRENWSVVSFVWTATTPSQRHPRRPLWPRKDRH
ncbi:MAG: DUF1592 domain-containing protein [Verrucomicrobiales bacterium]